MNIEPQATSELTRLCELIRHIPAGMLTSFDAEGRLVSRPMTPLEIDGTGAFWFFADLRTETVDHLIVSNLNFSDPDRAVYVSLSGRGEVHNDRAHIKRLWTSFAAPWFPDGPDSIDLVLIKFTPAAAEYWDSPHSKAVRMLAMSVSIVAGKPIGLGDHEVLPKL